MSADPSTIVPGQAWLNLVSGGVQATGVLTVPNATFLAPSGPLDGLSGSADLLAVYLAGTATRLDGGQQWLVWDAPSVATADGRTVFNPWVVVGTPGRWRSAYFPGQILGTNLQDDAPAGDIGEYVSSVSGAISLSTGTAKALVTQVLTAGDWSVWGSAQFTPAGSTTVAGVALGVNSVLDTLPAFPDGSATALAATLTTGAVQVLNCAPSRFSLPATTPVYLVGRATFGVSTLTATGRLVARRVR